MLSDPNGLLNLDHKPHTSSQPTRKNTTATKRLFKKCGDAIHFRTQSRPNLHEGATAEAPSVTKTIPADWVVLMCKALPLATGAASAASV